MNPTMVAIGPGSPAAGSSCGRPSPTSRTCGPTLLPDRHPAVVMFFMRGQAPCPARTSPSAPHAAERARHGDRLRRPGDPGRHACSSSSGRTARCCGPRRRRTACSATWSARSSLVSGMSLVSVAHHPGARRCSSSTGCDLDSPGPGSPWSGCWCSAWSRRCRSARSRLAVHQPAQPRPGHAADDGPHRDLGHLLPDHQLPGLAAVDRARCSRSTGWARDALGAAARRAGGGRDRRVVAAPGDRRGARGLGGRRPGPGADRAAPDGAARVRLQRGRPPREGHAAGPR